MDSASYLGLLMSHPAHSILCLQAPRVWVVHFSWSHPRTSYIRQNKNISDEDTHQSSSICSDKRPRETAVVAFQPIEMSFTAKRWQRTETRADACLRTEEMHANSWGFLVSAESLLHQKTLCYGQCKNISKKIQEIWGFQNQLLCWRKLVPTPSLHDPSSRKVRASF